MGSVKPWWYMEVVNGLTNKHHWKLLPRFEFMDDFMRLLSRDCRGFSSYLLFRFLLMSNTISYTCVRY